MKPLYLLTIALLFLGISLSAQQLPYSSAFYDNGFAWNPGMTAHWNYLEVGANYRQQWFGFEGAPRTALARFQFPFVNLNMAAGAVLMHDVTGPLTHTSAMLTYAYRLRVGDDAQLSLGISGTMGQFRIDPTNVKAKDPGDQLILNGEDTDFQFNAGVGLFFTSTADYRDDYSHFYAGIAAQQLLPNELKFDGASDLANFQRELHGNAVIGYRNISDYSDLIVDPSVWVNFVGDVFLVTANLKFELQRVFWLGAVAASDGTMGVQGGFIKELGDGLLRIGMMGNFNLNSDLGSDQGFGYEFLVGYQFEVDY
ncbi:MAG: PorP/SprF family type IX secretion system membrane protein [Bacteroidota bacterium]